MLDALDYSLGNLVEILFNDISTDGDWQDQTEVDEAPADAACKTAGYFICSNSDFTILAGISGVNSSDANSIVRIPTGAITSHRMLS